MFQYECEKTRGYRVPPARRPLPPRPDAPATTTVPLKVWIIASASCFSVCAVLVLATVVVTRWGAENYPNREMYAEVPEPIFAYPLPNTNPQTTTEEPREELSNDIQYPVLEKLSIFKNVVANRDRIDLASKPQLHPMHDTSLHHPEKKIEKKDQAVFHDLPKPSPFKEPVKVNPKLLAGLNLGDKVPEFKPTLPDVFIEKDINLDGFVPGLRKHDYYEDYYNDENLYDDYMQSNTMTSYLIEKVQELHDWITSDPDFEAVNATMKKSNTGNDFRGLLKALNDSLIDGNVTIVMRKLKDIYFSDNSTSTNQSRKVILSNSTDLLSFGILTLDVVLLHNIQLMAWENQESTRTKMLQDPDVFAFHALFLEPAQLEAARADHQHDQINTKRQNRPDPDAFDLGKNLLENVMEIGMSTARAAVHLGRAYKNTRNLLSQLSRGRPQSVTELDCVWLLYCRNLVATGRLAPPYGTMARINGAALRLLAGEPAGGGAARSLLEALGGGPELRCADMFPRCSQSNAAAIVLDSITQPSRKQNLNRT